MNDQITGKTEVAAEAGAAKPEAKTKAARGPRTGDTVLLRIAVNGTDARQVVSARIESLKKGGEAELSFTWPNGRVCTTTAPQIGPPSGETRRAIGWWPNPDADAE